MEDNIICSGALFYSTSTKRFLFLQRTSEKTKGMWGLVGGRMKYTESAFEGLKREIQEEIGSIPKIKKTLPLETFVSNDEQFEFHTYIVVVQSEFIPVLNSEHNGYAWCSFGKWPKPLHLGLRNTLQNKVNLLKLETVFKTISLLDEK